MMRLPRMPGARLLRNDVIILRNGFDQAFSTWRDRLLLAVMIGAVVVWCLNSVRNEPSLVDWRSGSALSLLAGFGVQSKLARALDGFIRDSPLAADALAGTSRLVYMAGWHGVAFPVSWLVLQAVGLTWSILAILAYLLGTLLAVLGYRLRQWHRSRRHVGRAQKSFARLPPRPSRGGWCGLAWAVARRQVGRVRVVIPVALAYAVVCALSLALSASAGHVAFAVGAVVVLIRLSRIDHAVVAFAAFAGHDPAASVAAHVVVPGSVGLVLAASAWPVGSASFAGAIAAIVVGTLVIAALRVFAYRLYPKRRADLMLTLMGAGGAIVASSGPFILPLLLAGAAAALGVRSRAATWLCR